ncbi:MAG: prepilin-type N-terminal cleavage/methylation domain-containing protein [Gammaproteobacteria bacterium]|nr:prepilin-type N-terminal cleavage/methylation domain-containing protein [Gammaproteobacteria bacterium]
MRGFTTVELLIAIAIVVIASAVALPFYGAYADRAERSQAAADLMRIDMTIERFSMQNFNFPDALADIGLNGLLDPWGRPYAYLRIDGGGNVQGQVRKDRNLNPINSDFDLYSVGPDGLSVAPLTAPRSRDDIVRAGNGSFFGVAEDF